MNERNKGGRPAVPRTLMDVNLRNFKYAPEQMLRKLLSSNGIAVEPMYEQVLEQVEAFLADAEQGEVIDKRGVSELTREEIDSADANDVKKLMDRYLSTLSPEQLRAKLKQDISRPARDPFASQKIRIKIVPSHAERAGKLMTFSVNGINAVIPQGSRDWIPISKMFITGPMRSAVESSFNQHVNKDGETVKDYYTEAQYNVQIHPDDMKFFPEGLGA